MISDTENPIIPESLKDEEIKLTPHPTPHQSNMMDFRPIGQTDASAPPFYTNSFEDRPFGENSSNGGGNNVHIYITQDLIRYAQTHPSLRLRDEEVLKEVSASERALQLKKLQSGPWTSWSYDKKTYISAVNTPATGTPTTSNNQFGRNRPNYQNSSFMKKGPSSYNPTKNVKTRSCYNCGRPGHLSASCRVKARVNHPRNGSNPSSVWSRLPTPISGHVEPSSAAVKRAAQKSPVGCFEKTSDK